MMLQKTINKKHNLNWPQFPDYPHKRSGRSKTNLI